MGKKLNQAIQEHLRKEAVQKTERMKRAYQDCFRWHTEAIEFENQALSSAPGLLPQCALLVREYGESFATTEYWVWLMEQLGERTEDNGTDER